MEPEKNERVERSFAEGTSFKEYLQLTLHWGSNLVDFDPRQK